MRKSLLIFAAASLLLAGCAKEQPVEKELSNVVVTEVSATFEDLIPDGATKASVDISGSVGKFSWQGGDEAAFILDSKKEYGRGTYNENNKKFSIVGIANDHHDAVYPYDLVGSTSPSTENVNSITVPASRAWAEGQTNVSMYGSYSGSSYTFKHLGGLVKVKVVNVPVEAKTFVFKTAGKKINGTFSVEDSGSDKVINTSSSPASGEDTYTLNLNVASANTTMDFYVPLPVGEDYVFSFYLKDSEGKDLAKVEGSTEYDVARKSILVMPTITLTAVDAGIEDTEKAAVVQEVPAGHSGDFLLANSEKVLLKVNASEQDKDITLKYNGGELPTNLEIQVVGDKAFDKKISGVLPKTHVDFTTGEIANVEMTTSASTFEIVYPAKISTKLTVKGGNVKVKGATVAEIVVAADAKADGDKAPVEIVVEKKGDNVPAVTNGIKANADVVVAPAENVTVKVTTEGDAKVANGGAGTVKDKDNNDIDTKAAAKIGDIKYITLADAIAAVKDNETIEMIADVDKANGISVPSGKNFTVDFGGYTYTGLDNPAGSTGTTNQVFQLLQGSTITFKNGKINVATTNSSKFRFIIQNYANLTLEDVTIDGTGLSYNEDGKDYTYALSNNCGTVNLNGNTSIIASTAINLNNYAFDVCKYASYDAPTVTWNSTGSVDGIIELTGGEFVVAKNLALTRPIRTNSKPAILTINQDATISQSGAFPTVHTKFTGDSESLNENNSGLVIVNYGGDLTIKGAGTIEATQGCTAAVCMTEKKEVYSNADAKLKVENVTLKGKGIGITGNGGRHNTVIVINNAKIYGTSTADADEAVGLYHPQEGTLTINGSNTIIQGLASGVEMRAGTLTVNDGTIEGTATTYSVKSNGSGSTTVGAGLSVAPHTTGKDINVTINGGTFKGAKAFSNTNPEEQPSHVNITINGGEFSDLSGLEYIAESGTYKLANNVGLGENILEINSGKTFSIDLNGKTLTGRTNIKHGNVTFKNGNINGGNLQALNVYGSSESSATNYSVVTVDSDVTVTAEVFGVCLFGPVYNSNVGYGAGIDVKGTITTTKNSSSNEGAVFVSGNLGGGKDADTQTAMEDKNFVNISGTVTSASDAALALQGSATATITGTLTGNTGIAAKRGKLIVKENAVITGNGACVGNPASNGNGTELTGSAVSASSTYGQKLTVDLQGGTYTSGAYTILNNAVDNACSFSISGGKYESTKSGDGIAVYARLGSVNITGGEFINNSNSEATLHVGCPAAVEKGLQPTLTISGSPTVKNNADGPYTWGQQGSAPLTVNMANELTYKAVSISGGEYHGQKPEKDDSWTEGATHKGFLASGATISGENNVWTVSANQN